MWSDATGKKKRNREQVKLLSMHWQWVSDWLVDFHVPGGVDRDGWQYAVDFPATYHAQKSFTDYVRRRRWYRRCAIATTGPFQELGQTKLLDVSLETVNEDGSLVVVWGLAIGGQAMVRMGVSQSCPMGTLWEYVGSDQTLTSISCGPFKKVWATAKNGCAYWRLGITKDKIEGNKWICVEPPPGCKLKHISVGLMGVWCLDTNGKIHVRKDVSESFPEGTTWQTIDVDPSVTNVAPNSTGFKHVSVGRKDVWVTTNSGGLLRRMGVCRENPIGAGWDPAIAVSSFKANLRNFKYDVFVSFFRETGSI